MICICASNTLFVAQILSTASQYGSACTRAVCYLAHQPCDANSIVRLGLGLALVAPPQSDLFRASAGIRQFLERPPRGNRRASLEYHRHVLQFMVAKDAPVPDIAAHRSHRPVSLTRSDNHTANLTSPLAIP